ncbi:hypothetical protein HJG60_009014 [Phyllostomus discolor]|uniref:Uncharacterized protein n=1 Tax=Phyllostomus discolor TaxID=89673 RepID=A0A833YPK3_9CHIR|nr:hypothetical protein HJG60_009014 [Phyllostomus discolor]
MPIVMQKLRSNKASALLPNCKEITQRTGCERQEFIRTYMCTRGGWLVKSPQHRLSQHRLCRVQKTKQTGHAGWICSHESCVKSKCQLFTIQAHTGNQFHFDHFLTEKLVKFPRSHSTLTNGLHYIPTRWEGELELGKGPMFFTYHTHGVNIMQK